MARGAQSKDPLDLKQSVNMVVSVAFIASFGLFATSLMLKFADMEDPITDALTHSIAQVEMSE